MTEFEKEWREVMKNYPNVARAYVLQQIQLAQLQVSLSKSICERIGSGEIVVTAEMYRKSCIKLGDFNIWESELGRLAKCMHDPPQGDINNCFSEDE